MGISKNDFIEAIRIAIFDPEEEINKTRRFYMTTNWPQSGLDTFWLLETKDVQSSCQWHNLKWRKQNCYNTCGHSEELISVTVCISFFLRYMRKIILSFIRPKNRFVSTNMPRNIKVGGSGFLYIFVSFFYADFRTKHFLGAKFNKRTIKPINNKE